MHIGIGAAILILGLLWLATSKAGLKVLGVLAVVSAVGVGSFVYWDHQTAVPRAAAHSDACEAQERQYAHPDGTYHPYVPGCPGR